MFEPGQAVTWKYQPRGGYGYIVPVPATVVAVTGKRVRIQVLRRNGQPVKRYVRPEHLKAKGAQA